MRVALLNAPETELVVVAFDDAYAVVSGPAGNRAYQRDVLRAAVSSRFVVGLHAAFASEECVHFVLDHAAGGDLHGRLIEEGTLPPSRVVLYAAQVALGLALLQDACPAVYRDLSKPVGALDASRLALFRERWASVPPGDACAVMKMYLRTTHSFTGTPRCRPATLVCGRRCSEPSLS